MCNNIADLAEHGVRAAPAMDGLLEEQGLGIQKILVHRFWMLDKHQNQ